MNAPLPHPLPAIDGAAMDTRLPRRRARRIAACVAAVAMVGAGVAALWQALPHGLLVEAADLRVAAVERGVFVDQIVVRASAAPLHSVILDSVESGRVEEVYASDGSLVKQGQLLFKIFNPQRNLELLARQAEHAQQISNLSSLRVAQEASASEHQRRLDDLAFALEQGRKQHARNERLAAQGFVSAVALEESADRLAQQARNVTQEQRAIATEASVRQVAADKLETAIAGLSSGLRLVSATVDALAVRAPVAGRLTDFRLQVGESIATGKNVGRIDDPARFKLVADIDEFYLNRVAVGRRGSTRQDGRDYALALSTIYPQIKDGRFSVELEFSGAQPPVLNPGQGLDAQITLGEPAAALLLPNGAFINDSGGSWVFVLAPDGHHAARRAVRIGRRNDRQIEVLAGLAAGERVILSSYAAFGNAPLLQVSQ